MEGGRGQNGAREGDEEEGEFTPGLALSPGYRSLVTIVRKGCWTGPTTGPMQTNQEALPPDYAVVRGCATDFCNTQLKNHDTLPNLSQGVQGAGLGSRGRGRGRGWRGEGGTGEPKDGAGEPRTRLKGLGGGLR